MHALFMLANPNVGQVSMTFITFFVDMVCLTIKEEWDTLWTSIRDGVVPEFDSIHRSCQGLLTGMWKGKCPTDC